MVRENRGKQLRAPTPSRARTRARRKAGVAALADAVLVVRFVANSDECAAYLSEEERAARGVVEVRLRPEHNGAVSLNFIIYLPLTFHANPAHTFTRPPH